MSRFADNRTDNAAAIAAVAAYWNEHIHDREITTEPVGSAGYSTNSTSAT